VQTVHGADEDTALISQDGISWIDRDAANGDGNVHRSGKADALAGDRGDPPAPARHAKTPLILRVSGGAVHYRADDTGFFGGHAHHVTPRGVLAISAAVDHEKIAGAGFGDGIARQRRVHAGQAQRYSGADDANTRNDRAQLWV